MIRRASSRSRFQSTTPGVESFNKRDRAGRERVAPDGVVGRVDVPLPL